MFKRLLFGLVKGLLIGGLLAAVVIKGLGMVTWTAPFAFAFAALAGLLTALLTGKPIWAAGAKVENGLKSVMGVVLALIGMFGFRKWVGVELDLSPLQAGLGQAGDLPGAALPAVSMLLALLFELDNTGQEGKTAPEQPRRRVAQEQERPANAEAAQPQTEELDQASPKAQRRS